MRCIRRDDVHAFRKTETRVKPLRIAKHIHRPGEIERRIPRPRTDERGPRRTHDAVVRLVHAKGDLPEDVLLTVLRTFGVDQLPERRQVATRCRRDDAIIQRHQIRRLRTAARVPRAADLVRDDVRAALQVVDHPHAVPDAKLRHIRTDQRTADAHHCMLRRAHQPHVRMRHRHMRRIIKCLPLLRDVEHLIPLSLADGVVAHRRQAVSRQQDRRTLILPHRLAIMAVSARHQHRRPRSGRLRQIQIPRHMKSWTALKQDLLHAIPLPLQRPHHLRFERHPLRQSANLFEKKRLPFVLPRPHRGLALDHLLKRLAPPVHHPVKLLLQPHFELLIRFDPFGRRFQDR